MPIMRRVLGLDLGSHALKAVELRQTFRGLEPVQFRVQPRAGSDVPLSQELAQMIEAHQLPLEFVVCTLPSDRLTLRRLEFPFKDRKRLRQTVPFAVEGETPFDLDDILVAWDEIPNALEMGSVVVASVAHRRDVSRLLDELSEAACDPRILEAEGVALGNLAATYDLSGRRLLVDLGYSKTTLCLMVDGRAVWSRSFRIGAGQLTEAIAKDLAYDLDDAERWKCEEGIFAPDLTSPSPGALEVLDRIAREIVRSLDALEPVLGGSAESRLDGITLIGGGARLHRIDEYLSGRTAVPAARLSLPPSSEDAALVAGGDAVLFAPALALALRGSTRARTGMNFRQDEFVYRTDFGQFFGRDLRGTAILAGTAAALLVASMASSTAVESGRSGEVDDEIAAIYRSSFPDQEVPADPIAAMGAAVQSARERADFLGVYGADQSALDLLTELSSRIPPDLSVVFEEVTIDPKVVRIKVSGSRFEDADRVIEALRSRAPFEQARVTGETKKVKGRITFGVSVPLSDGEDAS